MRRLLAAALLLPLAALALGADSEKHNTLTPKEAAEGWLLLFDGESTYGWRSPNDSKWTVAGGMLAPQAGKPGLLVTTTAFTDFELSLEYRTKADGKAALLFGCDHLGKQPESVKPAGLPYRGPVWCRYRIIVEGHTAIREEFHVGRSGSVSRSLRPSGSRPAPGHLVLSGEGVVFRNIKLKPLNAKPIFSGKDLSGWKEYPGKKSKFTVTKEGWLNVKNGPGDLQTEGQWADFVLQLDCISNGTHLNSGVFFRCIPGQYQNGYEAQIRNQFTREPRDYAVEEYDPETHKLLGKKKVQSTAVDYGTGAIYRRMPARREVAKDGEWFTLTVVANGRHFATWVNGRQVADWTDNRPLKDNPRNGCRLEKGAISLQGHDPTTDLSFRNLRIADLKKN
jgi:3-keto-disaccharide hydrolase